MATIKDVARLAQVSIGTVSNVLNGKTKNEDLIRRVENAVEQLSYRPDANARNLKNTNSGLVGVMVPDLSQPQYAAFLQQMESLLREHGYSILVKLSRNNRMVEKKGIAGFMEQGVDGIVIYSATHVKSTDIPRNHQIPMVLITGKNVPGFPGDQIILDYTNAFGMTMDQLKKRGLSHVGLIMEYNILEDGGLSSVYRSYFPDMELVKSVDSSRESGFQALFQLAYSHPELDGVIAGSSSLAQGIKKAQAALGLQDLCVAAVKESSWIEDEGNYDIQMTLSQTQVAERAAECLLRGLEEGQDHEFTIDKIEAKMDWFQPMNAGIRKSEASLRFAMLDSPSARSLQMLSSIYMKESGAKVEFDLFTYQELEDLLYAQAAEKCSGYDGFMMDLPWLDGLIESGYVKNLDEFYGENREFFDGFLEGVLKDFGMYVESVYGVPFMSGAQLLFYQRDLFEDKKLKILYQRMYKSQLQPPKTWEEFNHVAEFFTQSLNDKSPVPYGASLARGVNVYTSIYFLSHLWSFGGRIFDGTGRPDLDTEPALNALKNMVESYRCTSGLEISSWNEISEEFKKGRSAMIILYDSDAGDINNYTSSKVAGNLGFDLIPGGTPVMGGWSLALNTYGRNQKEAEQFLLWACGLQNSIPLALLGGSTLRAEYYNRSDLENIEPWKPLILPSFRQSRKRIMPEILDDSMYKNTIYTRIIPEEIQNVLAGRATEEEALKAMQRRITEFMNM